MSDVIPIFFPGFGRTNTGINFVLINPAENRLIPSLERGRTRLHIPPPPLRISDKQWIILFSQRKKPGEPGF
jgi:hypothetical protein